MKFVFHTVSAAALGAMLAAPLGATTLGTRAATSGSAWVPTATQALSLRAAADFGAVPASMPMHLTIGLSGNRAAADVMVRRMYAKNDAMYHKFLTPAQFTSLFAASPAAAQAVASYLQSSGFSGVAVAPNRLIVTANAPAAVVQRAFNTSIHAFAQDGKAVYANVTGASVPAALSGAVSAVLGLDSFQKRTFNVRSSHAVRASSATRRTGADGMTRSASPCLNPGPVCALNTYYPTEEAYAYDANPTTGRNTNVAIFTEGDLSAPIKDLYQTWVHEGLGFSPIREVDVLGKATDTSGDDEWDIDTQASTVLAHGVKSLTFYNGTGLTSSSIAATFNQFATDDTATLGNASFGGCEALSEAEGEMAVDDLILAETVLQGQSVFASSGDGGSQCSIAVNPGAPVGGPAQTEYPAVSPYVVAVGGTSLLTNTADDSYYGEIAWVNGGGGASYFENSPSWQYNTITLAQTGRRLVPDIAMNADPNVSGQNTVVGGTYAGYGGTSLASPLSMGVWARVASQHDNTLGFAGAALYFYYNNATAASGGISTTLPGGLVTQYGGFRDILTGSNSVYQATPGFDLTTGMGSLDINQLEIGFGS